MSRAQVHGRRASRARSGIRPGLVLALVFVLAIVGLATSLANQLKGPVASSADLARARGTEREALVEQAFLNSELALANTDSINIVLDCREGKMWIVLKGVRLRECRLKSIRFDSTIRRLVQGKSEALWVERPFVFKERLGTLPDPWKPVVEGPVDTARVIAVKELPMQGSLVFDRGLVIHIDTPPTKADSLELRGMNGFRKRVADRLDDARTELNEILHGPATCDMYVRISREDAASVLRALPIGGGLALHL